jgi:hypothetical protein
MTDKAKKALQSMGVPTVSWNDNYQQFYTRIGYRKSASGKRQQAFHYLGKDEREAVSKAAALKSEWRALKKAQGKQAVWPSTERVAKKETVERLAPNLAMRSLSPQQIQEAIANLELERDENDLEDAIPQQTPTLRLEQVQELFDTYLKSKIGVGGGEGLKASTYKDKANNLRIALAYTDPKANIATIGYEEIEAWKLNIFRRVEAKADPISKRTAVNYCRAVKSMLDWAHTRKDIPYRHAEDYASLFSFKKFTPTNIEKYDKDKLKRLLSKATDRERLYCYLALNCGYYQSDIGGIRLDEIRKFDGRMAIVRKREKTSHQNDFEAAHVLWDETYALLKKEMAQPNEHGRALLNSKGEPLYSNDEGKSRYDAISDSWEDLRERSGEQIAFKQLRKIGASAMERIGGLQARRQYKAGAIDSGDKVYVLESFENLTPHLLAWGKELRKDKVLK